MSSSSDCSNVVCVSVLFDLIALGLFLFLEFSALSHFAQNISSEPGVVVDTDLLVNLPTFWHCSNRFNPLSCCEGKFVVVHMIIIIILC